MASNAGGRKRKASFDAKDVSKENRNHWIVTYQGQQGSYTSLAAQAFFQTKKDELDLQSLPGVKAIFDSLSKGQCTYGVLPLESSSYGTIHGVYDRLVAFDGQVVIVGEMGQIEQYCLCIKSHAQINPQELDIDQVICHPHILECCSDYLDSLDSRRIAANKPRIERIAASDSAAACCAVANSREGDKVIAAVGSREAAELNGLKVLVSGIGNDKNAEVC
jgi:chorismate mutase / prephenate dehydratase